MPPLAEFVIKATDVPEVVERIARAEHAIEVKNAALRLYLETEHPDEGCRFACPGAVCTAMRDALAVGV